MLNNELKAVFAIAGMMCTPLLVLADQPGSNGQGVKPPSYQPGELVRNGQLASGYNQSATYECATPWEMFFTADYILWKWQQDSFLIGTLAGSAIGTLQGFTGASQSLFQNPKYASGFQAGGAINLKGMDNWSLYSEYTWYRNQNSKTVTATTDHPLILPLSFFRGDQDLAFEAELVGTLTSTIQIGFQTLDVLMERSFYVGQKLIADLGLGLKTEWITQRYTLEGVNVEDESTGLEISDFSRYTKQTSWSLGPKFALDTNWLLGRGFRLLANLGASVLYTSYNLTVSRDGDIQDVGSFQGHLNALHNYGTLRPVTEAFLGFGWGTYLCNRNFHLDFSAGYDFNVYWNYNMLYTAHSQIEGNMYLHGLNIQGRLDF